MNKFSKLMICGLLCLTGCTTTQRTSDSTTEPTQTEIATTIDKDAYALYQNHMNDQPDIDSYSITVNSTYTMSYSDDTKDVYVLDGVLQAQDIMNDNTQAKLSIHIDSNGGNFSLDGNYYNGRLYNNYNGVKYYEDMSFTDLKNTMVVPTNAVQYPEASLQAISGNVDDNGIQIYTLVLNQDSAKDVFESRFDSYGISEYEYEITSNQITVHVNQGGYFTAEYATFQIHLTLQGQEVDIVYESTLDYRNIESTEVKFTDAEKQEDAQYVAFTEIDTDSIETYTTDDDSMEDSIIATFKKRLVNRLDYEINEDGHYQISYNDAEVYIIDFDNYTFSYANYSIRYVYNFRGDVGTMGACTLDFKDGRTASGCEDSTVEMIRKIKTFFEMELYYCGLSLDQLLNEINGGE